MHGNNSNKANAISDHKKCKLLLYSILTYIKISNPIEYLKGKIEKKTIELELQNENRKKIREIIRKELKELEIERINKQKEYKKEKEN